MDDRYRDLILRYARDPANQARLSSPSCSHQIHNPLCGDQLIVDLEIQEGVIQQVGLGVRACALTSASAALMREAVQRSELQAARDLGERMRLALKDGVGGEPLPACLEPLLALGHPAARLRCLELPWLALEACAADYSDQP